MISTRARIRSRTAAAIPNALSLLRAGLVPVLLALALAGAAQAFLACLCVSLLSDAADGFLARRLGVASALGTRLDTWADLATFGALPFCACWLEPAFVRAHVPWLIGLGAALWVPTLLGLAKYGRVTSYHTRGAKLSATLLGAATVCVFAHGPWLPFRLAAAVAILAELEEIAITAVLPVWCSNIPTLRHACALRRHLAAAPTRPSRVDMI